MTGKKKYGIIYTILFAMLFMACFGIYLIVKHKSFLRVPDGLNQYYLGFLYIGRWGRSIFRNLFENHRFQILLWDPSIGYGADVPTTFSYCFWDPFCWISFFIPSRYAEYGYEIMILLKLYTAGLVFSKYAFHRLSKGRYSSAAILAGALVYTFSAVSWSAFGESFLINFLILYPLLKIGADHIYENGKSRLYVTTMAFSFAIRFPTACIMLFFILANETLRMVLELADLHIKKKKHAKQQNRIISRLDPVTSRSDYRAQHYALYMARKSAAKNSINPEDQENTVYGMKTVIPERGKKRFAIRLYLRFLLETLLALGIASVSLIPYILSHYHGLLSSLHLQESLTGISALQTYYRNLFYGFTAGSGFPDRSTFFGFGVFAFLCVLMLFSCRGKYHQVKIEFILMTLLLCIPFAGHTDGDALYSADRWIWAYALLLGFLVTLMIPEIPHLRKGQLVCLFSGAGIYALTGFLLNPEEPAVFTWISAVMLLMILVCLYLARKPAHDQKRFLPKSQIAEYSPNDKVKTAAAVARVARDAERERTRPRHFSFDRVTAISCIGLVFFSSVVMSCMAILGTGSFRASSVAASDTSATEDSINSLVETESVADAGSLFSNQVPAGMAYALLTENSGLSLLNDLDFSDGARYEGYGIRQIHNAQWLYGVSGTDFAGNRYNQNINAFQNSVALAGSLSAYCYSGLDRRSELLALFDVNHVLTTNQTDVRTLPAGFSEEPEVSSEGKGDNDRSFVSYAPVKKNSLFYIFNKAITENTYYALSPLERQQALMQAVVQNDTLSGDTVSADQLTLDQGNINYSMENGDGVEMTKVVQKSTGSTSYMISVNRSGAYLDLILDTPLYAQSKNPEVCLYLKNLAFTNGSLQKYKITVRELYRQQPVQNASYVLNGLTPYSAEYTKKPDRLLNIGRTVGSADKIRLYFNTAANFP